jgi:hypothetical protein
MLESEQDLSSRPNQIVKLGQPSKARNREPLRSMATRLSFGWLILFLYSAAYTPLGLTATALLGSLDPNHQIQVSGGNDGLQLVLHHSAKWPGHHHGTAARVLTFFAQSPSPTDPDHVIQFSVAIISLPKTQITAPKVASSDASLLAALALPVLPNPEAVCQFRVAMAPLSSSIQLVCLRSTVLLI